MGGLDTGAFSYGAQTVQRDFLSGCSGYGAIYADPPWQFAMRSEKGLGRSPDGVTETPDGRAAPRHYATMPTAAIKDMPVGALAGRDCALFVWAVDSMLQEALDVGRAWGFEFKTVAFYWAKTKRSMRDNELIEGHANDVFPIATGYWTRANPELCLLFTRGAPSRKSASVRKLLIAPRREHSRKPDEARSRIEQLVDGPYLELFARSAAPGWDAWGNQVDRFAAGEAA